MHQIVKICLSKYSCAPVKIIIDKPTITTESPICPFDFYVQSSSFIPPLAEVHHTSTVWELASDINFLNVLASIETIDDKEMVIFPSKLLKESSTYYLRAYFVTDYGESEWSEVLTVNTKFITTTSMSTIDITGSTSYPEGKALITETNNKTLMVCLSGSTETYIEVAERVNDLDWVTKATYSHPSGITAVDPNIFDVDYGEYTQNTSTQTQIFQSCSSETELFFCATLMSDEFMTDTPRGVIGIYLFKYDTITETLTTLITDNTGLFKRSDPALFYYNREIFIQGGYQLDTNGVLVTPVDGERTLLKYNLDTTLLSEVVLTTEVKPSNYRYSMTSAGNKKSYLFSGHGLTKTSRSSEFWIFDHINTKWIVAPMFPFIGEINENNIFLSAISSDGLFLNVLDLGHNTIESSNLTTTLYQYDLTEEYWLIPTNIDNPISLAVGDSANMYGFISGNLINDTIYTTYLEMM